ncbi:MAG: MFS transporter [Polyangiales bacterium]
MARSTEPRHPASVTDAVSRLGRMGRALRNRNYRLFFTGQGISLVGNWITAVASSWLVYGLTDSAALLGVSSFASQAPVFFLAPFAGVWVDRVNRHRVILATQTLAMLQSGLLAFFALRGSLDVAHIIALNVFQGLITAFDLPARQAFLSELIADRADLPNAVALNSSMFNAARLVGPSIAALLIGLVGEAWCFVIDTLSYVAVLASLLAMRVVARPRPTRRGAVRSELREGFGYVLGFAPLRAVLGLLTVISLVGAPYTVLMPVVAREVLGGDARTLGLLTGCAGLGALSGALYLASRPSVLGLSRMIPRAGLTLGLSLIALSQSRWLPLSMLLMVSAGGGMMVHMASSNTIVQTIVDEDKRGRVMSFYSMAVFGVAPFGALLAGALADRVGAPATLLLGGLTSCFVALGFRRRLPTLHPLIRPIYERLGILPEVASGVSEATRSSAPPPA